MIRTVIVSCVVILALSSFVPVPASASSTGANATYDTVDAVEVSNGDIAITGILSGGSAPTTATYTILNETIVGTNTSHTASPAAAARCDRLALLMMTKPGKFQLVLTSRATVPVGPGATAQVAFSCKLVAVTN